MTERIEALTMDQVAARLGLSIRTVIRLVQSGELKSIRPTERTRRIRVTDLERYLDQRANAGRKKRTPHQRG